MPTVSVALDDARFSVLSQHARNRHVTVDELVRENIDEFLKRQSAFQTIAQQVVKKNEELYQRLGQRLPECR